MLISVPKLGPNTGLAMLSCFTPEQLALSDLSGGGIPVSGASTVFADTVGGLMALGYTESEAARAAESVFEGQPDLDVGAAIRSALRILSGGNA